MKTNELIEDIQTSKPIAAQTLVHFPRALIDPCLIPLGTTIEKQVSGSSGFTRTRLYSPNGLPCGHYARLQIAYLTAEMVKNKGETSHIVSRSIRKFFEASIGQAPGGATQKKFVETLEKVHSMTFYSEALVKDSSTVPEGSEALAYRDNLGSFGRRPRQVVFRPTEALIKLVDKKAFTPIDLRALQIFRNEDLVLAHDVYIYLCHKLFKQKTEESFMRWDVLHRKVFTNCQHLDLWHFKQRFIAAVGLIKRVYPRLETKVHTNSEKGVTLCKHIIVPV